MKSRSTSRQNNSGFTLVEVLLVLALLVAVASMGLFYNVDSFRRTQFRSERDMVVSVLEQARAQAMANINEQAHGVHIDASNYILFSGNTYNAADPNNRPFPSNTAVSHAGMSDVVFSQVSGDATVTGGALTLTQGSSQSVISVSNVGQIEWTN